MKIYKSYIQPIDFFLGSITLDEYRTFLHDRYKDENYNEEEIILGRIDRLLANVGAPYAGTPSERAGPVYITSIPAAEGCRMAIYWRMDNNGDCYVISESDLSSVLGSVRETVSVDV